MTKTTLNIDAMSQEQLDDIALMNNSVVGELQGWENLERGDVSEMTIGDWGFQWVGTQGSDTKGLLILKPTNRRTKTLLVKGRCQHIKRKWNLTHNEAVTLVTAMRGEQYVNEQAVLSLIALSLYDLWWNEYVKSPDQQIQLIDIYRDKYPDLKTISKDRVDAAARVVMKFRESLDITSF